MLFGRRGRGGASNVPMVNRVQVMRNEREGCYAKRNSRQVDIQVGIPGSSNKSKSDPMRPAPSCVCCSSISVLSVFLFSPLLLPSPLFPRVLRSGPRRSSKTLFVNYEYGFGRRRFCCLVYPFSFFPPSPLVRDLDHLG